MNQTKLLTPEETADRLHVTEHTLAVWRCENRYPLPFVKMGRRVLYRESDIEQFIQNRLRNFPTKPTQQMTA